jgi:hypothetical protein
MCDNFATCFIERSEQQAQEEREELHGQLGQRDFLLIEADLSERNTSHKQYLDLKCFVQHVSYRL